VSEPDHRFGPFAPATSPQWARVRKVVIATGLERGLGEDGLPLICERAAVDPAAFASEFGSVRDCAMRIYEANIAEFDRIVFTAVEAQDEWLPRLRAAAYASLRYVAARPAEARFNFIAMLEAGELAQVYRDRYVKRIVTLIDEGRFEMGDADSLSVGVAEGVFGAVYEFLARKIDRESDVETIDRYVPELMYIAVRPYLGDEMARQELTMPSPEGEELR
jgi:hypothetical protein